MNMKKTIRKSILIIVLMLLPATLFAAGTTEVTARERQFDTAFKALDLPYEAKLAMRDTPIEIAFDFSEQKDLYYRFHETIAATVKTSETESSSLWEMEAAVEFALTGIGTAQLTYQPMEQQLTTDGTSVPSKMVVSIQRFLHEDGTYPDDSELNFLYRLQFPVTADVLSSGATVTFPVELPLPGVHAEWLYPGELELIHAGYVTIGEIRYVKLLSTVSFGESAEAAYPFAEITGTGHGVSYFDPQEGRFYYSRFKLELDITEADLTPGLNRFTDLPGEHGRTHRTYMIDSLFQLIEQEK